ncbi:MAG TPA: glycosyltransferase family 2 protein, partial [Balneolaceae bacterium]|nr:glycosyltransferase family 2 protein [Balneolaceae bacterium]
MNLVTVIIPIYNMAGFLPEAVQSVIDNNFAHTEIIIVDDGSTDHSLKVAKRIVRKTQTKSIRVETKRIAHRGKSFAVNEALKMATGDFITFLDADDKLPGSSLDLRVRKLQTAEADIALGEFEVFSNEKVTGRRKICANN